MHKEQSLQWTWSMYSGKHTFTRRGTQVGGGPWSQRVWEGHFISCGSAELGLTRSGISARHENCLLTARAQQICLCQEVRHKWGTRGLEGKWCSLTVHIPWLPNLSLASVPQSACFLGRAHSFLSSQGLFPRPVQNISLEDLSCCVPHTGFYGGTSKVLCNSALGHGDRSGLCRAIR